MFGTGPIRVLMLSPAASVPSRGIGKRPLGPTADRIDHWIRRHVVPCPPESTVNPARDRRVAFTAIARCLKDQYDAIAPPMPPRLAALVKQLETQKGMNRGARTRAAVSI
jgi:hypothetical protein